MARHVALLRGINVGRNKRIAMADLRSLCERLGFEEVRTLLQSGNVVLDSALSAKTVGSRLAAAIEHELGLEVGVVVRAVEELDAVVAHDPFGDIADPPKYYSVSFLASDPASDALADVAAADFAPERFELRGRELYLWCRRARSRAG